MVSTPLQAINLGGYEMAKGKSVEIKAAVVARVVEAIKSERYVEGVRSGDAIKGIEAELNAEYDAAIAAFYKTSDAVSAFRELFWSK